MRAFKNGEQKVDQKLDKFYFGLSLLEGRVEFIKEMDGSSRKLDQFESQEVLFDYFFLFGLNPIHTILTMLLPLVI